MVNVAWNSFISLGRLMRDVGLIETIEKACPPTTRMEFLGTLVDTIKMTLEIAPDRLQELKQILFKWTTLPEVSRKELESLIGKLSFVTNCVRPGRVFLARLILALTKFPRFGKRMVTEQMKNDVRWWLQFLDKFNRQSMLWLQDTLLPNVLLATDVCLDAAGATCELEYLHSKFPDKIKSRFQNIAHLEMWAIILVIRTWKQKLSDKIIHLYCDNEACIAIINSGKSKEAKLQQLLRELVMELALNDIWLKMIYISTKANVLPDLLSRWYINGEARRKFKSLTNNRMTRRSVTHKKYKLSQF